MSYRVSVPYIHVIVLIIYITVPNMSQRYKFILSIVYV